MTTVHVVPTDEPLELHKLADCPCQPRPKTIPRSDGTSEVVTLHRPLDDDSVN